MEKPGNSDNSTTASVYPVKPYDFPLSLRILKSLSPDTGEQGTGLRMAAMIADIPAVVSVSQARGKTGKLSVSSSPATSSSQLAELASWILFVELDLNPFYQLASANTQIAPIIKNLYGIKPMRPPSLFEMAVVAITEQQISLSAAYRIRSRVVQKFGRSIQGQWIFPTPQSLAEAQIEDLRTCGLSRQKADYIQSLARRIADGKLEIDKLKEMDDIEAREEIVSWRGFGRWSADYILIRGLARPDCVPIDDLAIRSVVGQYLAEGQRISAPELEEKLEPFRPYRGLLAFYLLADNWQKKI
jgi:DNA-3-methyladenine glycosylase II